MTVALHCRGDRQFAWELFESPGHRYPQPDRRRDGSRRLGDYTTGEGRTRQDGEREIEVVVFHIDYRVDELAPRLARARRMRLDAECVYAP